MQCSTLLRLPCRACLKKDALLAARTATTISRWRCASWRTRCLRSTWVCRPPSCEGGTRVKHGRMYMDHFPSRPLRHSLRMTFHLVICTGTGCCAGVQVRCCRVQASAACLAEAHAQALLASSRRLCGRLALQDATAVDGRRKLGQVDLRLQLLRLVRLVIPVDPWLAPLVHIL